MKVEDFNLLAPCFMVVAVLILTAPSRSREETKDNETKTSRKKYDSGQLPVLIESRDHGFVVKWRGEMYSWRNLSQLLHQHNITLLQKKIVLAAVLHQKNSSVQSCQGRCLLNERRHRNKTCFCDNPCKLLRDCCLDFQTRCGHIGNGLGDTSLESMTCGDINDPSRAFGIIMKSSCSLHNRHTTSDCQTVHRLNMTLEKELPVSDWAQNITYRSVACARCSNAGNLSIWGIDVSCPKAIGSFPNFVDIMGLKRFLMEHKRCWWKYAPGRHLRKQHKSCVLQDTQCASNQLPVMSVVKELCSSYSMVFSVKVGLTRIKFRNPHCALCNSGANFRQLPVVPFGPPLSILLDVSSNIVDQKEPKNPQFTPTPGPVSPDLAPQIANCTSSIKSCTVSFGGQRCEVFTSKRNQSLQNRSSLNRSYLIRVKPREIKVDKNTMALQGNSVYILCQENRAGQANKDLTIVIYVTFVGTLLSITSLCLLLSVYFSFKELRNLPGKCLMNLSLTLLCYQTIFLCAAKSKEVVALCKAVAIFLHFFFLAGFAWMTVMGFDTAKTFTTQVTDTRRQPSDVSKIFIKYCIVGWGLPAVVVVLCYVLEFTGTFHFGYGNSIYCWISDGRAIAVAVVTPVSLALLFNVMCLGKNVHAIRHLQQAANLATNNSSQASLILICIKLSTVMGLTWILGLLANWNQTAFLEYPSTVLNSMQGFFIALCFTITKKVRGLIKKRWNGAREANIRVPRDQCTGHTQAETAAGFNMLDMKNV